MLFAISKLELLKVKVVQVFPVVIGEPDKKFDVVHVLAKLVNVPLLALPEASAIVVILVLSVPLKP